MTESSTGLPVSEPSISSLRPDSATRLVPRPSSSAGYYTSRLRERELQYDPAPLEHYPRHTHYARQSPWSSETSAYEEELLDYPQLSTPRLPNRNIPSHHSYLPTSTLPRDPYMIDRLPSSFHPHEPHLGHSHRHMGTSRYQGLVPSRTAHDQYSGREHYALKPFQVILSYLSDFNSLFFS